MTASISEETPLLVDPSLDAVRKKHEEVYDRFTPARKRVIVALVSFAGLMPLFISGSFYPSVPDIANDLDSNGTVVSLAISLSVFAASIGALIAAAYSSYYGRKPVYLVGLPLLCLGSIGTAISTNVRELLFWRFVQAFGASPGLSVGAGSVGDIYKLEERGTAIGIYFGACLVGPALAPTLAGIVAQYFSWRVMQFGLGAAAFIQFVCILFFYPETSHPGSRGIEKWRANAGVSSSAWHLVLLNPLKVLALLRSPNLLFIALAGTVVLLTDFVILTPLSLVFADAYGITNRAFIGLCYSPLGIGNIIGAPLAGTISDRIVVYYRNKRKGVWYPEDRLRGTLFAAGVFVPLSVLISGFLIRYVRNRVGLILNLVCFFFNGIGVDLVLSPCTSYVVDVVHSRSAEGMAATMGLRSFLISICVAGILPLVDRIGVVATNAIAACLGWLSLLLLWLVIRYGEKMRAWIDVGYSTQDVN